MCSPRGQLFLFWRLRDGFEIHGNFDLFICPRGRTNPILSALLYFSTRRRRRLGGWEKSGVGIFYSQEEWPVERSCRWWGRRRHVDDVAGMMPTPWRDVTSRVIHFKHHGRLGGSGVGRVMISPPEDGGRMISIPTTTTIILLVIGIVTIYTTTHHATTMTASIRRSSLIIIIISLITIICNYDQCVGCVKNM